MFSNPEPATIWGLTLQYVPAESNWPSRVSFVSDLVGVQNLMPNPSPDGGGLHQAPTDGDLELWNVDMTRCVENTPDTNSEQCRYVQRRRGRP
jgi:hypothetical protein